MALRRTIHFGDMAGAAEAFAMLREWDGTPSVMGKALVKLGVPSDDLVDWTANDCLDFLKSAVSYAQELKEIARRLAVDERACPFRGLKYWLYECPPQDDWDGFLTVGRYVAECCQGRERAMATFLDALEAVREGTSWERDGFWRVFAVPSGDCWPYICFTVKQSNNGTTFVASPVELPWLKSWVVKCVARI